jgi:hypothetical protein
MRFELTEVIKGNKNTTLVDNTTSLRSCAANRGLQWERLSQGVKFTGESGSKTFIAKDNDALRFLDSLWSKMVKGTKAEPKLSKAHGEKQLSFHVSIGAGTELDHYEKKDLLSRVARSFGGGALFSGTGSWVTDGASSPMMLGFSGDVVLEYAYTLVFSQNLESKEETLRLLKDIFKSFKTNHFLDIEWVHVEVHTFERAHFQI